MIQKKKIIEANLQDGIGNERANDSVPVLTFHFTDKREIEIFVFL